MKRYEFCYLGAERRPNFAIIFDNDILSACERILFRPITGSDLTPTDHGNYFLQGWEPGEIISVKQIDFDVSTTFHLGKPQPVPETKPTFALNLEGLDLSKASPQ